MNYGLQLLQRYQYWFINFNKFTTLHTNARCYKRKPVCVCVGGGYTAYTKKYMGTLTSVQFCCKTKTAIKKSIKKKHRRHITASAPVKLRRPSLLFILASNVFPSAHTCQRAYAEAGLCRINGGCKVIDQKCKQPITSMPNLCYESA